MTEQAQFERIASLLHEIGKGAHANENSLEGVVCRIKEGGSLYCDQKTSRSMTEIENLICSMPDQSKPVLDEHDWVLIQVIETSYAIAQAAVKDESYDHIIREFIHEIKSWYCVWIVAVPIHGISLFNKRMEIGGYQLQVVGEKKTSFAKARKEEFCSFDRKFRKRFYVDENLSTQDLELKELDAHIGQVHLLLHIKDNPIAAKVRGIEIAKRFLDIIRFCSEEMFPIEGEFRIGLSEESNIPDRQTLLLSNHLCLVENDSMSPGMKPRLDAMIFKLKERQVEKLLSMLAKESKTELEKDILLSIRWYSLGYRHKQPGVSFLNIITALECFVEKSRNGSGQVSRMVSRIICENSTDRKEIKRKLESLYRIRQTIAHEGFECTKLNDLELLESYYARFITKLVDRLSEWRVRGDILDHLNSPKQNGEKLRKKK